MLNSKPLRATLFCSIVLIISLSLNFLLVPLSSLNKKFIAYRDVKKNIDFLVIGDSLEGDGIDPKIIGDHFSLNAYVFAPQGGYPESSYYILLDVLKSHTPRTVVVGWDLIQNFQIPDYQYPHEEEIYRELAADSAGNIELQKSVISGMLEQRYASTFFEWASFSKNIAKIPEVQRSRKPNVSNVNTSGVPPKRITMQELESYDDFNYHEVIFKQYGTRILPVNRDFMIKIRDLCAKRGIRFYVIANPVPECVLEKVSDMTLLRATSASFFKDLRVPYIDGLDQKAFPGSTVNSNFKDCYGHIVSPYREIYTESLCTSIQQLETGRIMPTNS